MALGSQMCDPKDMGHPVAPAIAGDLLIWF